MEPNRLINTLNEFKIIIKLNFKDWLLGNHIYLFGVLLGYIWFLVTFVNSSCDMKK